MLIKFLLSPVAQWLRHPTVEPLVIVGSNLGIGKKLFLPSNWHNRHTVYWIYWIGAGRFSHNSKISLFWIYWIGVTWFRHYNQISLYLIGAARSSHHCMIFMPCLAFIYYEIGNGVWENPKISLESPENPGSNGDELHIRRPLSSLWGRK